MYAHIWVNGTGEVVQIKHSSLTKKSVPDCKSHSPKGLYLSKHRLVITSIFCHCNKVIRLENDFYKGNKQKPLILMKLTRYTPGGCLIV